MAGTTTDAPGTGSPGTMRAHGIASLVEQTARHLTNLCWTDDMQAAQWAALRYFAAAGSPARNVVGLARFQGTNPGTASRTIAVLQRRGLVDVQVDPRDKRGRIITLTEDGRALLARDPLQEVERAIAALPAEVQAGLATGLRELLGRLFENHPGDGKAG